MKLGGALHRFLTAWKSKCKQNCLNASFPKAVPHHGIPEIINSDQGSQYTCTHWVETFKEYKICISMDGKGRATDNALIVRWVPNHQTKVYLPKPGKQWIGALQGNRYLDQKI